MSRVSFIQSEIAAMTITTEPDTSCDEQRETVTLQNVYELASEIGEHFKRLIAEYGEEFNNHLIPSVVKVLEHLENTVILREEDQVTIVKLQSQIEELTNDNKEREQKHSKFFSELEDIDETWRKEHVELSQYVKQLRNENKRLAKSLNDSKTNSLTDLKEEESDAEQPPKTSSSKVDKLKRKISILSREVDFKRSEVDSLRSQNNYLLDENDILKQTTINSDESLISNAEQRPPSRPKSSSDHYKKRIKSLESEVDLYKSLLKITSKEIKPISLSLYSRSGSSASDSETNNNSLNHQQATSQEEQQQQQQQSQQMSTLQEEIIIDNERPVQGPLPREPPEKSWRSNSSRIWSFFPRLTQALTGKS